jgi:hypothetical protein
MNPSPTAFLFIGMMINGCWFIDVYVHVGLDKKVQADVDVHVDGFDNCWLLCWWMLR